MLLYTYLVVIHSPPSFDSLSDVTGQVVEFRVWKGQGNQMHILLVKNIFSLKLMAK